MGLREDCYPHMTDIVADIAAPAALLISLTLAVSLWVTVFAASRRCLPLYILRCFGLGVTLAERHGRSKKKKKWKRIKDARRHGKRRKTKGMGPAAQHFHRQNEDVVNFPP